MIEKKRSSEQKEREWYDRRKIIFIFTRDRWKHFVESYCDTQFLEEIQRLGFSTGFEIQKTILRTSWPVNKTEAVFHGRCGQKWATIFKKLRKMNLTMRRRMSCTSKFPSKHLEDTFV